MRAHFLLVMVFCVCFGLSCAARAAIQVDQPVASFVVQDLKGKVFDLATHKGEVVIVHFWATWCASCQIEMPILNQFYRHHHSQGVEVIAISIDAAHHRDDVEKMLGSYSFSGALLSDMTENPFGRPTSLPITYIINSQGVLIGKLSPEDGQLTEQILLNRVENLLRR